MKVDFLSTTVLLNRSKELNIPLSLAEAETFFNLFDQEMGRIVLTVDGIKAAAKILTKISKKKIKLNHSLEIMSREFFNLPWHSLLPRLEKEESSNRIEDVLFCLSFSDPTCATNYVFTPGLLAKEEKVLKSQYPNAILIQDKQTFIDRVALSLNEIEYRKTNEIRSLFKLFVSVPFYVNAAEQFQDFDTRFSSKFFHLSCIGRAYGVVLYFPNQGVTFKHSDRVPERYLPPKGIARSPMKVLKFTKS